MRDFKQSVPRNHRSSRRKCLKLSGLLALLALVLVPAAVLALRMGTDLQPRNPLQSQEAPPTPKGDALFPMAFSLLPEATLNSDRLAATTPDGTLLRYSINPELQQSMQDYFDRKRPPYALFIALEPSTGRIISLATSSPDASWDIDATYRTFPMASLFKMVTAAAALEHSKITPTSEMAFRGRAVSENPAIWDPHPRKGGRTMDMTEAMGKSVNPIYGKLASDLLGREALSATCASFGFNRPLLPEIPVETSRANVPDTVRGLRLMGSGLDHNLKVSPLHAAAITAAIANNGVMMVPRLIDSTMKNGQETPCAPPREITRIVQPDVADELRSMLLTTVTTGTSGRAFRTNEGRRLLSVMQVAAKTGSISGDDPAGFYTWFAAYAPAKEPKIALLALIINDGSSRIRASNVGEYALREFFKEEIQQAPPLQVSSSAPKVRELRKKKTGKTHRPHIVRKKSGQSSHRGKAA